MLTGTSCCKNRVSFRLACCGEGQLVSRLSSRGFRHHTSRTANERQMSSKDGKFPFFIQQEGTDALHIAYAKFAVIAHTPRFPLPPNSLLPPFSKPERKDSSLPLRKLMG